MPVCHLFEPICLLHNATQLASRAIQAWLVKGDSQLYVLKDSWVLLSHPFSEIETLRKIKDTMKLSEEQEYLNHCYPILIAGQDLGDSTDLHRATFLLNSPAWTHHHIVTGPVSNLLTYFWSKREFCSCIHDVVKCKTAHCHLPFNFTHHFHPDLHFLNVRCNIIYGDIFLNNLQINRVWPDSAPAAKKPSTSSSPSQENVPPVQDPVGYGLTINNDYSFEKHQAIHTTSVKSLNIKVNSSDAFILEYSPIHVHHLALELTNWFHPFRSQWPWIYLIHHSCGLHIHKWPCHASFLHPWRAIYSNEYMVLWKLTKGTCPLKRQYPELFQQAYRVSPPKILEWLH